MTNRPTKKTYETGVAHPAVFSDKILPVLSEMLDESHQRVLDPFAGVGRVHELRGLVAWELETVGVELEPEWATLHPDTIVGNALALKFDDATFDAVVTSPTYGNRLADHHNAKDGSVRRSYTHDLGRQLQEDNSGAMHWGPKYRDFHTKAWLEAKRILRPGGRIVLNTSDHIRKKQRQFVSSWHANTLSSIGFELVDPAHVKTPRLRLGANSEARVPNELVFAFDLINP